MGDKGVENNIQKWNEKRQKFIANKGVKKIHILIFLI